MKAFRKTLSVIITVLMVVGIFTIIPFTSFAAETDKSLTGIAAFNDVNTKTVVKFDNGEERTVKNAIKAESLEKNDVIKDIDSYEIKYRNKSVVEVLQDRFGLSLERVLHDNIYAPRYSERGFSH